MYVCVCVCVRVRVCVCVCVCVYIYTYIYIYIYKHAYYNIIYMKKRGRSVRRHTRNPKSISCKELKASQISSLRPHTLAAATHPQP